MKNLYVENKDIFYNTRGVGQGGRLSPAQIAQAKAREYAKSREGKIKNFITKIKKITGAFFESPQSLATVLVLGAGAIKFSLKKTIELRDEVTEFRKYAKSSEKFHWSEGFSYKGKLIEPYLDERLLVINNIITKKEETQYIDEEREKILDEIDEKIKKIFKNSLINADLNKYTLAYYSEKEIEDAIELGNEYVSYEANSDISDKYNKKISYLEKYLANIDEIRASSNNNSNDDNDDDDSEDNGNDKSELIKFFKKYKYYIGGSVVLAVVGIVLIKKFGK